MHFIKTFFYSFQPKNVIISIAYLSIIDEAVLLEVLLALLLLLWHEVSRVGRVALLAVAASVD